MLIHEPRLTAVMITHNRCEEVLCSLSWPRALAAAELASAEYLSAGRPRWNKDRVTEAIERRHEEGKALAHTAASLDDAGLVAAARR